VRETFDELVARVNRGAYISPLYEGSSMAKPVKLAKGKEFTFKKVSRGSVSKYPWDEWFTGELWLLEKDVTTADGKVSKRDYDVPTNTMPAKIITAARKRYKVVEISWLDADGHKLQNSLIIRSRDMTPEERSFEDALRAEEKDERQQARNKAESNGAAQQTTSTPQSAS
jgi:hypothetical protein